MQVESVDATVRITVPRESFGDASLTLTGAPSLQIRVVAPGTLAHLVEIQGILECRVAAILKRLLVAPASQKIPLEVPQPNQSKAAISTTAIDSWQPC